MLEPKNSYTRSAWSLPVPMLCLQERAIAVTKEDWEQARTPLPDLFSQMLYNWKIFGIPFSPASWACHFCNICEGRKSSSLHSLRRCLIHKEGTAISVIFKEWPSNAKHILVFSTSGRHIQNPRVLTFSYMHYTFSYALYMITGVQ